MSAHAKRELPIVLVDDEEEILFSTRTALRASGILEVKTLSDGRKLLDFLEKHNAMVVVLDLVMPHISGAKLLPKITQSFPEVPVIVMTATQEVETAVACMKQGAFDYLTKPVEKSQFVTCVKKAIEMRTLRRQVGLLKEYLLSDELKQAGNFKSIVTQNKQMRSIFQYVEAISLSKDAVLVTGETGAGKELLVEAIHISSGREGKLVALNAAGLDDNMFSDTLFGHTKGAFSGADKVRKGLIAEAAGGTLFLDEIGDLSRASQVKLLRLLQERKYYPLGSDIPRDTDARVVCATHQDLKKRMAENDFRQDLYYRLTTHNIHLPPLRERKDDLPLLLGHFLEKVAKGLNKAAPTPPPELFNLLNSYHFPGNIRELSAMVTDAVAQHQSGILSMQSFEKAIFKKSQDKDREVEPSQAVALQTENIFRHIVAELPTFQEAEKQLLEEAMRRSGNNQGIAAAMLGITRQSLNRRVRLKQQAITREP